MGVKYLNVWKIIGILDYFPKVLSTDSKSKKSRADQDAIKKSYSITEIYKAKTEACENRLPKKTIPVSSVVRWVLLLQIINSNKQDSSGEKIVSIATILSQQKVKNNSSERTRCYCFSLMLIVLPRFCARSYVFVSVSYHDSCESGAICHACSSFVT